MRGVKPQSIPPKQHQGSTGSAGRAQHGFPHLRTTWSDLEIRVAAGQSCLGHGNMEFAWSLQLLWILAAESYSPGERCVRVCWLPSATEGDTDDCSATASNPEQMLYKRENVSSLQRNMPASLSKPGPQQLLTTWHGMGLEDLNFSQIKTFLALNSWH